MYCSRTKRSALVRLELQPLGFESSTLPQSHGAHLLEPLSKKAFLCKCDQISNLSAQLRSLASLENCQLVSLFTFLSKIIR